MAMTRLRSDDTGLGLVEVIVSMLVLAVGILPAFEVFIRGHQTAALSQNIQVASDVATEAVEDLRARPWAALKAGPLRHVEVPAGVASIGRTADGTYSFVDSDGVPGTEPLLPFSPDPAAPADYERRTVQTDQGPRTFDVFRIVSARTESCPVVDLAPMLQTIDSIQTTVATLTATSGSGNVLHALVGQDGSGGVLATVVANTKSAKGKLTATVLSLLGPLLAAKTQSALTSSLDAVQSGSPSVQSRVASIRSALVTLSSQLEPLRQLLTSNTTAPGLVGTRVDLCQLPDDAVIPDLRDLNTANDSLPPLTDALGALLSGATSLDQKVRDLSTSLDSVVVGLVNTLLTTTISKQDDAVIAASAGLVLTNDLGTTTFDGRAVTTTSSNQTTVDLGTLSTTQTQRVAALLSTLASGNPGNTLRISVAVRAVGAPGPTAPIWVTTVITNPEADLL